MTQQAMIDIFTRHLARFDALGPIPKRVRAVWTEAHDAWEASALAIGQDCLRDLWTAAQAGDAWATGFVRGTCHPDPKMVGAVVTDAMVQAKIAKLPARWIANMDRAMLVHLA